MHAEPTVIDDQAQAVSASDIDVLIVGAGACGLVAALRAAAAGARVVVVERDSSPTGSTSMSSGFVPAPGTRYQRSIGVTDDSAALFESDILEKSKNESHAALTSLAAQTIGPALEWLADEHGLEWVVLDDFLYPNHSRHRMHAVPEKTGAALLARLLAAVSAAGIDVLTNARVLNLHRTGTHRITRVDIERPDGTSEAISADSIVLACNGYGGNAALVASHIPEIASGLYYGHPGNTGDAVIWGQQLNARLAHLSGYQGHGSLAHPHGILITWALMMQGGWQVNSRAERFSNEHHGYSEQAVHVLAQPDQIAWNIYDQRIHEFAQSFPDYVTAIDAGAIKSAESLTELASITDLPMQALSGTLEQTLQHHDDATPDQFGRRFDDNPPLKPPYYAVKVTGALFHTQGGLVIDRQARVLDQQGVAFDNLFAGGGAACGVSGPHVSGYLSGNGLLTAIGFGYIAGHEAALFAASSKVQ